MTNFFATQSIVVYRSKFEQQSDEFWSEFLVNNAWIMYVVMGVFALFFISVLVSVLKGFWRVSRFQKNFNKNFRNRR